MRNLETNPELQRLKQNAHNSWWCPDPAGVGGRAPVMLLLLCCGRDGWRRHQPCRIQVAAGVSSSKHHASGPQLVCNPKSQNWMDSAEANFLCRRRMTRPEVTKADAIGARRPAGFRLPPAARQKPASEAHGPLKKTPQTRPAACPATAHSFWLVVGIPLDGSLRLGAGRTRHESSRTP